MRAGSRPIVLACVLLFLSALLCLAHYLVFHEPRTLFFYLLLDVASIPVQVLLVSVILDRLLSTREKRILLKKMNMVIGAFFSEAGTGLIVALSRFVPDIGSVRRELRISGGWTPEAFQNAAGFLAGADFRMDAGIAPLEPLREILGAKRDFLLRLLENSTLLEHDSFTDLLWAVLHLSEELAARPRLTGLPVEDVKHLTGDLLRAYGKLLVEWISYLKHLKSDYPYLFSLAVRTNPFDPDAAATLRSDGQTGTAGPEGAKARDGAAGSR